jgi:hypothetical protein
MTAASGLGLRVAVPDVWDIVEVQAGDDWTVAQLKSEALGKATGRQLRPTDYIVKFRGAEVFDEAKSLRDLGVPDRGSLIVLPARRQPVR